MEEYTQKACILFCPFRTLKDLQKNGSYRLYFKERVQDKTVTERHIQILQNMQDCHNAMDSGTPKDALERCTEASNKTKQNNNNNDTDDTSPYLDIQEMIHQWNLLSDKFDPESETRFRDKDGVFKMETAVTRKLGKGLKLFATPKINTRHKAIYSTPFVYVTHNNESEAILVDDVILTKIEEMKSSGLYDILSLRTCLCKTLR